MNRVKCRPRLAHEETFIVGEAAQSTLESACIVKVVARLCVEVDHSLMTS